MGHVLKIYEVNGVVTEVLVHYLGWHKIYDEILDIKSPRLAPFGFYSARKEIPRYASQETEENYFSFVTTGNQLEFTQAQAQAQAEAQALLQQAEQQQIPPGGQEQGGS